MPFGRQKREFEATNKNATEKAAVTVKKKNLKKTNKTKWKQKQVACLKHTLSWKVNILFPKGRNWWIASYDGAK